LGFELQSSLANVHYRFIVTWEVGPSRAKCDCYIWAVPCMVSLPRTHSYEFVSNFGLHSVTDLVASLRRGVRGGLAWDMPGRLRDLGPPRVNVVGPLVVPPAN
jgi:hypothetical protein